MSSIRGLEILFAVTQGKLKSKDDCVVAALHCILTNSGLSCVGLGDDFSDNDSDSVTELLPENWNENQEVYYLRYRSKDLKDCYLLKIVKAGGHLHVNLVLNKGKSYGMTINSDDHVSEDFSKFSQTFKKLDQLNKSFEQDILENFELGESNSVTSPNKEKAKKKSTSNKKSDAVSTKNTTPVCPTPVGPTQVGIPDTRRHGGSPLPAMPMIGGNDLDPLGRSQGGMHFDPVSGGMLFDPLNSGMSSGPFGRRGVGPFGGGPLGRPLHSIPPGARFDPFSPIVPDRFNPDPDHFRPPDYDNMFM